MRMKTDLLGGVAVGVMLAVVATAPVQAKTVKKAAPAASQQDVDDLRTQLQALKDRLDEQAQINQKAQADVQAAQADAAAAKADVAKAQADLRVAQQQIIQTIPAQIDTAVAANKPKTDKFYYKGISITMGGFAEAASIYRDRDETADISSSFSKIPFANDPASHTGETRFTARQSRYSILAQGDVSKSISAAFYGEFDFQGAAQTANSNQSDSYNPRIRNLYGQIDWNDSGWHILGGQNWSLLTLQNNGITARSEVTPPQIDAQYIPGFAWARQPQIRITKDLDDKQIWVAASLENPQTTFTGTAGNQLPTGVSVLHLVTGISRHSRSDGRERRVRLRRGCTREPPLIGSRPQVATTATAPFPLCLANRSRHDAPSSSGFTPARHSARRPLPEAGVPLQSGRDPRSSLCSDCNCVRRRVTPFACM